MLFFTAIIEKPHMESITNKSTKTLCKNGKAQKIYNNELKENYTLEEAETTQTFNNLKKNTGQLHQRNENRPIRS